MSEGRKSPGRPDSGPKQFLLDLGTSPPARRMLERLSRSNLLHEDNVFFALVPDEAAASRIVTIATAAKRQYGLSGRERPAHVLHVSLRGVIRSLTLPAEIISAAMRVGRTVRAAPFEVMFDRLLSFRNGYPSALVLRCSDGTNGLTHLYEVLGAAMKDAGFKPVWRSDFTPHVTLLYDDKSVSETTIEEPVSWTARELVLVRSRFGQTRHDYLGRWPLREGG